MSCASSGLDGDDAGLNASRVRPDAVRLIDRPCHRAGFKIHLPRMQRTHDGVAGNDAVAERSALMRALVVHGEKAIAEVEDRNLPVANHRGPAFTRRNAVAMRYANPFHDITLSIGRRGMNCVGLTGVCPSSHASREAAFDLRSRSSNPIRAGSGAYTVSLRTLSMPTRSTKSYVRSR